MLFDNTTEIPEPPHATWRIWSTNHQQWYRRDALGYTPDIAESGCFTPGEALAIYRNSARGWNPQQTPELPSVILVPV